jgi:hypothetical protein
LVRKPKAKGGLGVINLSVQNDALLLKQLDKFYKWEKIQWVSLIWQKYYNGTVPHLAREKGSFWWKDILQLNVYFRGVAMCIPNHGNIVSFWEDLINGRVHSEIFPHLLGFAKDPRISLWALRHSASLINCFRIPMSREAYNELLQLQNFLNDLPPVDHDGKDSWIFIWGQHRYSSSKYYHFHFRDIQPNLPILWIWKSKCIPRVKFFTWLLLNDRLNTRNILRRRRKFLEDGYNCVLCLEDVEESVEHLFFDCHSAACRWFALGITWNAHLNIHQKIQAAKLDFAQPFFMEIFMIGAWCIWNERNDLIFNGKPPCLAAWKSAFKAQVSEHLIRIEASLHPSILLWLQAL